MRDSPKESCEPPFWQNLSILFEHYDLSYRPTCSHSALNFTARIIILSLFIGAIGSAVAGLSFLWVAILFGGITAGAIVFLTASPVQAQNPIQNHTSKAQAQHPTQKTYTEPPFQSLVDPSGYLAPLKEHFVNGGNAKGSVQPVEEPYGQEEVDAAPYSGPALPERTPPTSRNPFMNILLDDIKYHPERPPAASVENPHVKQVLDDFFRIQWFSDPTDVFGKKQSQRQFITQPSTTVPNDQGSFANWLYKIPGKTCKEGGREACLAGTDLGVFPWLGHDS